MSDGGLLGAMQTSQDAANGWVERIVGRGWGKLNLLRKRADRSGAGQRHPGRRDPIAACVPDGGGGSVPVEPRAPQVAAATVAYVLIMAFTLVYTAEHYVIDYCSVGRWPRPFWSSSDGSNHGDQDRHPRRLRFSRIDRHEWPAIGRGYNGGH